MRCCRHSLPAVRTQARPRPLLLPASRSQPCTRRCGDFLVAIGSLPMATDDDKQSGSAALEGLRKVAWVTANYRFSRRTDVYAMLDRNRVVDGYTKPAFMGTLGSRTALSAGLRHRF